MSPPSAWQTGTGLMMSELIPSALDRKQPCVFISGPSFAREVMEGRPTGVVAACKDPELNRTVQELFASQTMRVNTTGDVVGVEICGKFLIFWMGKQGRLSNVIGTFYK